MTTVKCLMAIAAARKWPFYQLDVDNAFFHGSLDEDMYMKTPPGFYISAKEQGLVCKLKRSIYGLKQASCQWFSRFSDAIIEFGFVQSLEDYSLFTLKQGVEFLVLIVYVDDVVITGICPSLITQIKTFIHEKFKIKDPCNVKYFLGLEVARSVDGIFINQRKYVIDILEDYNFNNTIPIQTPMELKHNIRLSSGNLMDHNCMNHKHS
ncbi:unnamed protein product [Rhodiola kirilowii]